MTLRSDRAYLLTDQYRDASNLNARIQLHERFSTNPHGWVSWVFDQFDLPAESSVLEVGCGDGILWQKNIHRIPAGCDITLSDFSSGMLQDARRNLCALPRTFHWAVADCQSIAFADGSFDAVIANHMLYHVPDRTRALSEIYRIMKPGGHFYVSLNGRSHLRELRELLSELDPEISIGRSDADEVLRLENGLEEIARRFSRVTLRRYDDALIVTEAAPLIAYVLSGRLKSLLTGERLVEFTRLVERKLAEHGSIRITKDAGLLEAQRPDGGMTR